MADEFGHGDGAFLYKNLLVDEISCDNMWGCIWIVCGIKENRCRYEI